MSVTNHTNVDFTDLPRGTSAELKHLYHLGDCIAKFGRENWETFSSRFKFTKDGPSLILTEKTLPIHTVTNLTSRNFTEVASHQSNHTYSVTINGCEFAGIYNGEWKVMAAEHYRGIITNYVQKGQHLTIIPK